MQDHAAPLTEQHWGVATALVLTVFTSGVALLAGVAGGMLARLDAVQALGDDAGAAVLGGALLASYGLILLVVWTAARVSGHALGPAVGLRPVKPATALGPGLTLALGARLLAGVYGALLEVLGVRLPGSDIDPTRLLPMTPLGIALTVLLACVAAPVVEEIVFRGVLLSALRDRWGSAAGIGVSSAVFALVHVVPFAVPPIFVLAIALGRLFVRTRSLWVPIAAHALFNGIGVAALYGARAAGLL